MQLKKTILVIGMLFSTLSFSHTQEKDSLNTPNHIANFLGGNGHYQDYPYYTQYSKDTNQAWNRYYKKQFEPISKWTQTQNPIKPTDVEHVFYPFGGPDISHAFTFYPYAKKYTLIGLEPVGKIPDNFDKLSNTEKQKGLESLKQAISGVLGRNFFITLDMQKEVKNTDFNGVASLLVFFLNHLGNKIDDIKFISNDGIKNEGVLIKFTDSNKLSHELTYYSWDISNKGLEKTPYRKEILEKLSSTPKTVTMMKAASYLCWLDEFSQVRNEILKTSYIMSDVSGMPIKHLKNNNYEVSAIGSYLGPIQSFKWAVDKDLQELTKNQKSLPFKYSYSTKGESHLFFGKKIAK